MELILNPKSDWECLSGQLPSYGNGCLCVRRCLPLILEHPLPAQPTPAQDPFPDSKAWPDPFWISCPPFGSSVPQGLSWATWTEFRGARPPYSPGPHHVDTSSLPDTSRGTDMELWSAPQHLPTEVPSGTLSEHSRGQPVGQFAKEGGGVWKYDMTMRGMGAWLRMQDQSHPSSRCMDAQPPTQTNAGPMELAPAASSHGLCNGLQGGVSQGPQIGSRIWQSIRGHKATSVFSGPFWPSPCLAPEQQSHCTGQEVLPDTNLNPSH